MFLVRNCKSIQCITRIKLVQHDISSSPLSPPQKRFFHHSRIHFNSKQDEEQEEYYFYSEQSIESTYAKWLKAILFLGAGAFIGYHLSSFVVDEVASITGAKDDGQSEEKNMKTAGDNVMKDVTLDYRSLFDQFADVELNGEKFMSPDAFFKSLFPSRPATPSWVAYPREGSELLVDKRLKKDSLQLMYLYADTDSDGLISFEEYSLFLTLMDSSKNQLKLAFQMFDLDGSGKIDLNEFKHIINANKKDPKAKIENIDKSGLIKLLFGPDGTKKLSFKDFLEFIDSFKEQLLLHEFLMHDVEGKNEISVEAFNELITRSVHFNSLNVPEFKRQLNLLKTRGFFKPSGRVNFETFKAFHIMSEHIEDLNLAMHLYASGGRELKKEDFTKILYKVLNVQFPSNIIDLVFALFDKNGDGNLSLKEFISVMQKRNNYNLMLHKLANKE